MGLTETQADVDPAFNADIRGEAIWDTAVLWTLPLAGLLLASIVANEMYSKPIPIIALSPEEFATLRTGDHLTINEDSSIHIRRKE